MILAYKIIYAIQLVMFSWLAPVRRLSGGGIHSPSEEFQPNDNLFFFTQTDPAFRRAAEPALCLASSQMLTTFINSSIFSILI